MINEQCINALEHLQAYYKWKQLYYNLNIIPHTFHKGDLFLSANQRNANADPNEIGKFSPNWLGPYIVNKRFGFGAYVLIELDGTPLNEPINVVNLRWYYV